MAMVQTSDTGMLRSEGRPGVSTDATDVFSSVHIMETRSLFIQPKIQFCLAYTIPDYNFFEFQQS